MEYDISARFEDPIVAFQHLHSAMLAMELEVLEITNNKQMHLISMHKAELDVFSENSLTRMRAKHILDNGHKNIHVYDKQLESLDMMQRMVKHRLKKLESLGISIETIQARLMEIIDERDSEMLRLVEKS